MTVQTEIWDQGRLQVAAEFAAVLRMNGLETVDAVFQLAVDKEINNHRRRPVYKIQLDTPEGVRTFYLKRYAKPQLKNSVKPILEGKGRLSLAGREWQAIMALLAADIPTIPPVALGEEFRFGLESRSFLLTAEVPNLLPLNEHVEQMENTMDADSFRQWKRQLIAALAQLTRAMHAIPFVHGDWYTKHAMLRTDEKVLRLYVLDLQRAGVRNRISKTDIARELAGLMASAAFRIFTPRDMLRFFLSYMGCDSLQVKHRRLLDKILRRCSKLLERKKFKQYQGELENAEWRRAKV